MTASEEILKKAQKSVTVEDVNGRKIVLTKPNRYQFGEFLGLLGDRASNSAYLGWMLPILFVTMIGDEPALPLENAKSVRDMFNELGDEGHDAAMKGVSESFPDFLGSFSSTPEDLKKKSDS